MTWQTISVSVNEVRTAGVCGFSMKREHLSRPAGACILSFPIMASRSSRPYLTVQMGNHWKAMSEIPFIYIFGKLIDIPIFGKNRITWLNLGTFKLFVNFCSRMIVSNLFSSSISGNIWWRWGNRLFHAAAELSRLLRNRLLHPEHIFRSITY